MAIAPIIEQLLQRDQRLSVYLCASDAAVRRDLAARFPRACLVPFPFGVTATLFLSRYKVRALVAVENAALLSPALMKARTRRATPLALISGRGAARVNMAEGSLQEPEIALVGEAFSQSKACTDERFHMFFFAQNEFSEEQRDEVVALLKPLIGRDRKWSERRDQKLGRWIGQKFFLLLETEIWAQRLKGRIERINDLDALSKKLSHPATILCLGNGPSSEDPRLTRLSYDALFRANHAWAARGFLTQPDVVFTGVKASMRKIKGAILGVLDTNTEKVLLMTRGLNALFGDKLSYFVIDKIKGSTHEMDWRGHRPTSGAIMLKAAVQLKPERLIIAGIDMFQHPSGSYPGDNTTANAYAPAHTYDKELGFILHCLEKFDGEIIIIGDVLSQEWERFLLNKAEA